MKQQEDRPDQTEHRKGPGTPHALQLAPRPLQFDGSQKEQDDREYLMLQILRIVPDCKP